MTENKIRVFEPYIDKGLVLWRVREVSRNEAVRWAKILWSAPGFQGLPETLRAQIIRKRFIFGTLITMDEMRRKP